jgi:YjbE family integral membrane protein
MSDLLVPIAEIIWINILLSGDNAVVIALACRGLPPEQQKIGAILGAAAAIALRIIFTLLIVQLLGIPIVKLAGGILLLVIAINLLIEDHSQESNVKSHSTIWAAVFTITLADAVMSLDNVLAIAGAARGNPWLIVFGLVISIPLVVFGAGLVMRVIDRYSIIAWAGAALLGWVAGHMMSEDPLFAGWLDRIGDPPDIVANIGGAIFVLVVGLLMKWRSLARR